MNFLTTKRILKLGFTNFLRNSWLSAQTTFILTLTLLIVVSFVLVNMLVAAAGNAIKEKIDLTVFFEDSVPVEQIVQWQGQLRARSDISLVTFIDKDQALELWQRRPISPKIKGLVTPENNPLPRSLQIKTADPAALEAVAQLFSHESLKGSVRYVSYQETKNSIDNLLKTTALVNRVGLGLSVLFIIISAVVIINTIRLTIMTRIEEIEIMRLVGAAGGFIRFPFLIEATLFGVLASALALSAISGAVWLLRPALASFFSGLSFDLWLFYLGRIWVFVGVALSLGLVLSWISTLWAMRRHLRL